MKESGQWSAPWDKEVFKPHLYPPQSFSDKVLQNKSSPEKKNKPSLACWPMFGSVEFREVIYSCRKQKKKRFLFLIHTFSLAHCLIMPPILNCVRVTPLLSDKLYHPHKCRREMCKMCSVPQGLRRVGSWEPGLQRLFCVWFWLKSALSETKSWRGKDSLAPCALVCSFTFNMGD